MISAIKNNTVLLLVSGIVFLTSCNRSSDNLERQLKTRIEKDSNNELKIKSITLVKNDGNEFVGLLETSDSVSMLISVHADDQNFIYQIIDSE